jgi:hypothetical protein
MCLFANVIRVFAARSRRQNSSWTEPPERFARLWIFMGGLCPRRANYRRFRGLGQEISDFVYDLFFGTRTALRMKSSTYEVGTHRRGQNWDIGSRRGEADFFWLALFCLIFNGLRAMSGHGGDLAGIGRQPRGRIATTII